MAAWNKDFASINGSCAPVEEGDYFPGIKCEPNVFAPSSQGFNENNDKVNENNAWSWENEIATGSSDIDSESGQHTRLLGNLQHTTTEVSSTLNYRLRQRSWFYVRIEKVL